MALNPPLTSAIQEIRSADAFVVIGAGASFRTGMPLAGQLAPTVWHAMQSSPGLLEKLCIKLGVAVTNAKEAVGDDWDRITCAFGFIAADTTARQVFQDSICELNKSRCEDVSAPHDALARVIFARRVAGVLSLNWDTLLESAFHRRYGFWPSNAEFDFWKPHGDCASPDGEWVLPHQPGVVGDSIVRKVNEFARVRPRVLLIVGYSERDETVVERLIEPISKRWRVYRISPSACGEGAIPMDAGEALEALANELAPAPDIAGWQSVSFENQRGIEAAISGERLGPRDVRCCPQLPHFAFALRELDTLDKVDIAGASGSGKSITVWQVAHHYNQLGWHVIRPDASTATTDRQRIDAVVSKRWPRVVVVDDTQFQSDDLLDSLRELADDRTKVILGTTDASWERQNTIRVSASASVRALAETFRIRRNEILPVVQSFDSHVGDGFGSTRIEDRIESAARSETPWLFAYAVRGGWRQTRQVLNAASDFDENDLLLTAVAIRQLASLDAGATMEQLVSDAQTLGHDAAWVQAGVKRLESQRALLVGETIRCLHLQSASVIAALSFESKTIGESQGLVDLAQNVVSGPNTPLRGISWLLNEIRRHRPRIIVGDVKTGLLKRCFNAHTHIERRDACFVVAHMLGWRDITASELLADFSSLIQMWVVEVDREDAYGVASLINNLYNDDKELCPRFLDEIDTVHVAEKLADLECRDGNAWGYFLGRLCCGASQEWSDSFSARLPRDAIMRLVERFGADDLFGLSELIEGLYCFDSDFALACLERALPVYASEFAGDALGTYRKLYHLEHWVLGNSLFEKANPSRQQRTIAKAMFDGIDAPAVAAKLLACPFGDWEMYARLFGWARKIHPAKIKQIVTVIDWGRFDSVIGDRWKIPPRELRLLLSTLTADRKGEPIRSWIEEHAERIEKIDPILAGVSPEAAVRIVGNGNRVELGGHNGNDWDLQTWALAQIASVNDDVAKTVLRQNRAHLTKALVELSGPQELPRLLELIHELDGGFMLDMVAALSPDEVREKWIKSLRDGRKAHRYAARRVLRKIEAVGHGSICDLANELLRSIRYRSPR